MPRVRPRTSWLPFADLSQTPSCIFSVFSVSRRASAMISPITSSTTLRVFEYGALKTAMPRSAAATRSTWLVPMQKQPIACRSVAASSTRGVMWVLERMPSRSTPGSVSTSSSSDREPGAQLDLEAPSLEDLDGERMDVLEQQHLHDRPA